MGAWEIIAIIFAAGAIWYLVWTAPSKPSTAWKEPSKPSTKLPPVSESEAPLGRESQSTVDSFMQQVASEKARTDAAVSVALEEHERELKDRFADDIRLKENLSQFARDNELDKALVALWMEIKYLPARVSRDDFHKCNKLNLSEISGSKEKETESIEFMQGAQRFKVTHRRWSGMEGGSYADLSFWEDGDEVFGIRCEVEYEEYGSNYRCFSVSALKKRGNWAKVLLQCYGQIQIEEKKSYSEHRYYGADEIKSRFEE
jgi:hypothetical protein